MSYTIPVSDSVNKKIECVLLWPDDVSELEDYYRGVRFSKEDPPSLQDLEESLEEYGPILLVKWHGQYSGHGPFSVLVWHEPVGEKFALETSTGGRYYMRKNDSATLKKRMDFGFGTERGIKGQKNLLWGLYLLVLGQELSVRLPEGSTRKTTKQIVPGEND